MTTRGPILTLLGVVVLALVLLGVNMSVGGERAAEAAAVSAAGQAAASGGSATQPGATQPGATPPGAVQPDPAQAAPAPAAAFPIEAKYTGLTSGRKAGEATVAITISNGVAKAYVCDGNKLESWMEGKADGASLTVRGKGTDELTGELIDGKITGRTSVNGVSWQFSADPGEGPGMPAKWRTPGAPAPTEPSGDGSVYEPGDAGQASEDGGTDTAYRPSSTGSTGSTSSTSSTGSTVEPAYAGAYAGGDR